MSSYDLVLFGATGFTGRLTARRLATDGPPGMRWAIAGRDRSKLDAVAAELAGLGTSVAVETADLAHAATLRELTGRARLVVTTVGPFVELGAGLVAACAETGTDYVDITGEPEFVDRTWLDHQTTAERTGARIVHACGFDSVPHDLGALFTVRQLPDDVAIRLAGFVRASGTVSGGTYHSAIRAFSRVRQSSALGDRRRELERSRRALDGRRVRALARRPVKAPDGRGWGLPLPTIDPTIVRRSARALAEYGPDFSYGHYALVRRLPTAVMAPVVLGATVAVAQLPPGRDLLLRLRSPGSGPTAEEQQKAWFKVRFVAEVEDRVLRTEVAGGDPGYGETAMMLSQSALCMAFDDLPVLAGQLTTAQAMGDLLLSRLQAQGMTFRVVDERPIIERAGDE